MTPLLSSRIEDHLSSYNFTSTAYASRVQHKKGQSGRRSFSTGLREVSTTSNCLVAASKADFMKMGWGVTSTSQPHLRDKFNMQYLQQIDCTCVLHISLYSGSISLTYFDGPVAL